MAFGYLRGEVLGNLGGDPETRYSADGTAILTFTVAGTNRVKQSGEWTDATTWVKVTVFGKTAEQLAERLSKGSRVLVRGELNVRTYDRKDGGKGFSTEIAVRDGRDVVTLDKAEPKSRPAAHDTDYDDTLPF